MQISHKLTFSLISLSANLPDEVMLLLCREYTRCVYGPLCLDCDRQLETLDGWVHPILGLVTFIVSVCCFIQAKFNLGLTWLVLFWKSLGIYTWYLYTLCQRWIIFGLTITTNWHCECSQSRNQQVGGFTTQLYQETEVILRLFGALGKNTLTTPPTSVYQPYTITYWH